MKIGENWRIRVWICWWVTARNEWVVRRRCTLGSATQIMIWFVFANPFLLLRVHGYGLYPIQHQIYHTRLCLDQTQTNLFRSDNDWLKITLDPPPIARMSLKLPKILLFMGRFSHESSKLHFEFSLISPKTNPSHQNHI